METVLQVHNVQKYYGSKGRGMGTAMTKALDGVSFDVRKGEFIAIMGTSGSGKSTLLNCISTIDRPTAGQIVVDGRDVTSMRQRDLSRFRRERLGFVFQDSNLLDTLTGEENVALALTINRVSPKEIPGRVEQVAAMLDVADVLKKYPYQMSGGQRQRIACARAIVTRPAIVLADEPTGALDSKNSRLLLGSLAGLNRQGATILMVTHDSYAASWSSRVLFIKDGRIFNELSRGDESRQQFFQKIMDVVSFMGGEAADVR